MQLLLQMLLVAMMGLMMTSCVSKKKFVLLQSELETANKDLGKCGENLNDYMTRLSDCSNRLKSCELEVATVRSNMALREEQIGDLRNQIADYRSQRDQTISQVDDLTVLSQSASDNIKATLAQLQQKDKYIRLLAAARTKADSINLALAVNLKGVLKDGIEEEDVNIKVDKTVVFINLSDKMLYNSGSAALTPKADEVLGKIAQIIKSRPELEVMVEGYTDNVPITNSCISDNWDLSVMRATSVVRVLQGTHGVDPNRLIAAGRGAYNTLASNDTEAGRSINRRTRIIIMPKLNQFYDLLNPSMVPE